MSVGRSVAAVVFPLVFVMLGGVVSAAHHSRTGYEGERTVTLTGIVTEFRWRNPHTFLVWTVTDENGNEVEWAGEMLSIQTVTSWGLTRNSFQPGDEVTVTAFPATRGTPVSIIQKVVMTADGKVVVDQTRDEAFR
jgi:hypothetical protein